MARGWGALVALLALGCTVEDVIVDTGDALDTGTLAVEPPRERPDVEPTPDPDDEAPTTEPDTELTLTPSSVGRGEASVVFLNGPGLEDVAFVSLYGEPDATLSTWTQDGPERLILVVDVAAGSPAGELLVVVEHDDGSVSRPEASLGVD